MTHQKILKVEATSSEPDFASPAASLRLALISFKFSTSRYVGGVAQARI